AYLRFMLIIINTYRFNGWMISKMLLASETKRANYLPPLHINSSPNLLEVNLLIRMGVGTAIRGKHTTRILHNGNSDGLNQRRPQQSIILGGDLNARIGNRRIPGIL
ncbi:hypothetical protein L9F63_015314, partial [Diploptera punctata]